jgi:NTE family protein
MTVRVCNQWKWFGLGLWLLASCAVAAAPGVESDDAAAGGAGAERPRIGLVLGGGGARGAAHIGVLQVLEEHRIPIDSVAGTSMGALVGGIYASGRSASELEALVSTIDWPRIFDDASGRGSRPMRRKRDDLASLGSVELGFREGAVAVPRGALQGHRLLLWLRRQTLAVREIDAFDALPIPFAAVATDIVSGERVVLSRGDLAMAMRASMAVPGVFAPIRVDGRMMVDGGVVENIPVRVARGQGAERMIVVDVGAPLLSEEELGSPLSISLQMVSVLMKHETDRALAELGSGDILIRPALGALSSAAFESSVEAIAAGRAAAIAALPELQALALDTDAWTAHLAARGRAIPADAAFARLDVAPGRSRSAERVARLLQTLPPGPLDVDHLEQRLDQVMAIGDFERINYRLHRDAEESILLVEPVDKGWGPGFLRFGFAVGDDFDGRSSYQMTADLRLTGLDDRGREWRNRVSIGQRAGLLTELHQPLGEDGRYYLQTFADYEATRQPLEMFRVRIADYTRRTTRIGAEFGFYPDPRWQLSAGLRRGHRRLARDVGAADLPERIRADLGSLVLGATYDTLDNVGFPRDGARFDFAAQAFRPALGSDARADVLQLRADVPLDLGPATVLFGMHADWALSGRNTSEALTFLGGFAQLTGLGESERLGSRALVGRALAYRRLNEAGIVSVPLYFGGSLEAGQNWLPGQPVRSRHLDIGGSLFLGADTLLGPVYLGYGRLSSGEGAAFLRIGSPIEDLRR